MASAPRSGRGGRPFESDHPDKSIQIVEPSTLLGSFRTRFKPRQVARAARAANPALCAPGRLGLRPGGSPRREPKPGKEPRQRGESRGEGQGEGQRREKCRKLEKFGRNCNKVEKIQKISLSLALRIRLIKVKQWSLSSENTRQGLTTRDDWYFQPPSGLPWRREVI